MIEFEDGSAGWIAPASFSQAFRVRIADVTGFSVAKGDKAMTRTLHVLGNGTTLASATVNHGVAEKIEAWFRAHPMFGRAEAPSPTPAAAPAAGLNSALVADELRKLADLRAQGILTDDEFAAQKARLLS
jgi:hypothetical protein